MSKQYEEEFKKRIVNLHLGEGRTIKSLSEEYNVSKGIISIWIKAYREECQTNHELKAEIDYKQETLRLRRELEEMRKENQFLKKAAAFFAKEID